jgi:hypothetical protein
MDIPSPYLTRIRACFPDLPLSTVRMNRDGLGNDVMIINEQWVFRFAKYADAKQLLQQEARVLALARQYVDMRLPLFTDMAEDFVAYALIPGEGLHFQELRMQDDAIQEHLAAQLATFLRQLHTIPLPVLQSHHIPPSAAVRTREDRLHRRTWACQRMSWSGCGSFARRRGRCRRTVAGERAAPAPSTRARRAGGCPGLGRPPCRRRSPGESAAGVTPREGMRGRGVSIRLRSPRAATVVTATGHCRSWPIMPVKIAMGREALLWYGKRV